MIIPTIREFCKLVGTPVSIMYWTFDSYNSTYETKVIQGKVLRINLHLKMVMVEVEGFNVKWDVKTLNVYEVHFGQIVDVAFIT